MNIKLCLLAATTVSLGTVFADSSWKGDRLGGEWSNDANWDGGVPVGNVVADVASVDSVCRTVNLTPPTDFTGVIRCHRDDTTWAGRMGSTLRLNVLDGAAWTVAGDGYLYVTENIAPRISADFTGLIVVPAGMSFVAPETLDASVEFAGNGTLTLSSAARLEHIAGFTGTLVWAGPALTPEDTLLLQNRRVRFGDGASVSYAERFLAVHAVESIPDFTAADAWSFNGSTVAKSERFDLDTTPPHVAADGSLVLLNDAAQVHSVVFKGRRLKAYDSWGVHFTCEPSLPADSKFAKAGKSQKYDGMFGVYMTSDPTNVGTTYGSPLTLSPGFAFRQDPQTLGWYLPNLNDEKGWISQGADYWNCYAMGAPISLHSPFDVDVTFKDGIMTTTLTQDGKSFTIQRRTFNGVYGLMVNPDGYYIAIAASNGWWGDDSDLVPWGAYTLRGFRGWYRAREAGGWSQKGEATDFYPISSEKWVARRYDSNGTLTEPAIESDGSFLLHPGAGKPTTFLGSKVALSKGKKYLVNFDFDYGEGAGDTDKTRIRFGFTRTSSYCDNDWVYRFDQIGYGQETLGHPDWSRSLCFSVDGTWSYYRCIAIGNYWGESGDVFMRVQNNGFGWPKFPANETMHMSFVYDGRDGLYLQSHSKNRVQNDHWIPQDIPNYLGSLYLVFTAASNSGSNWIKNNLRNITVKELTDNSDVEMTGVLEVAADATVSFGADASVPTSGTPAATIREAALGANATLQLASGVAGSRIRLGAVSLTGDGASIVASASTLLPTQVAFAGEVPTKGLKLAGDVVAPDGGLTVVVPAAWAKTKAKIPLMDMNATSAVIDPASVRVVSEQGEDLLKKGEVKFASGCLIVDFSRGLMLLVK